VRGTQICNFFEKIFPPDTKKIKTNRASVREKNPEKMQILKLQYLDLPNSVSDDFFFNLGVFMIGTHIYNLFIQNFHINIPKCFGMLRPSFFFYDFFLLQK
jgi:hypothetical protein